MSMLRKLALGVIGALVAACPLLAHHEWPVDRTKLITVKGTVTAFTWATGAERRPSIAMPIVPVPP